MEKQKSSEHTGRKICAWCKKDLGSAGMDNDSHGICFVCSEIVKRESTIKSWTRDEAERVVPDMSML